MQHVNKVINNGIILHSSPQGKATIPLGTVFAYNMFISSFTEYRLFGDTKLSASSFRNSSIAVITFPDRLTKIDDYAFMYCDRISELILNEGLTEVGRQWIWGCKKLVYIDFPSTIQNIDTYGLVAYESKSYEEVFRSVTPPTILSTTYLNNLKAVYVPDESVEAYKTASVWSNIASKIKPLSEYTD